MSDPSARTFSSDFRRFFLRGLVVLLPSILTLWIVVKAYQFVDSAIAEPINRGVRYTMNSLAPVWQPIRDHFDPTEVELAAALAASVKPIPPEEMRVKLRADNIGQWWAARWYMDLIGLVVAIVGVYIAGRVLGGYLGRKIYQRLERLLTSVPIVKQVYPYVKQFVDFVLGEDKELKFSGVVMVQYPRQGVWSIGFQTGSSMKAITDRVGETVTVFIPWTPTPFTGYAITVPRAEVVELPITVEEAIRFVVSGGVLIPDHQHAAPGAKLSERAEKVLAATGAAASTARDPDSRNHEGTSPQDAAAASRRTA